VRSGIVQSSAIHLRIFACTVKENFIVANFDTLPRFEKLVFYHEFFLQDHLYVNNICEKFQGQKIHPKKDIQSLPTCEVVNFHCCQLCHLFKDWNISFLPWNFCHEITYMSIIYMPNFKFKRFTPKKVFEIYQHVLL